MRTSNLARAMVRNTLYKSLPFPGYSQAHPVATKVRVLLHLPVPGKETMKGARCSEWKCRISDNYKDSC